MANRDELIENCRIVQTVLSDSKAIDEEIVALRQEAEVVSELIKKGIYEIAHTTVNQYEYLEKNNGYVECYNKASARIAELKSLHHEKESKHKTLQAFINDIKDRPLVLTEFDEELWIAIVDKVMVLADGKLIYIY